MSSTTPPPIDPPTSTGADADRPIGSPTLLLRLAPAVYLPWFGFAASAGVLAATFPLVLERAGLSTTIVGLLLAISGIGSMAGGLPIAVLIRRLGEDRVLLVAMGGLAVTSALLAPATTVRPLLAPAFVVAVLRLLAGAATTAVRLSRQAMLTTTQPAARRGRAMALMGGTARVGLVVGPALGGVIAETFGFSAAFLVAGVIAAGGVALFPRRRPEHRLLAPAGVDDRPGIRASLGSAGPSLLRGGVAAALVTGARSGRLLVLPLLLDEVGLNVAEVGLVISLGLAAELILFPAAGATMDRFGRLWCMVPAYGLMAVGLFWLAVVDTAATAIAASIVVGVGNGLASGTMLTLSSDLAPADDPGPFLAAIATISDIGKFVGPLLVGLVADAAGLGTSAAALGVMLAVAVVWLIVVVGGTRGTPQLDAPVGGS